MWDITNAMNDAETKGFDKGKKEGEKIGIEKGREEGEKLGIEKTALNMLKKGMSVELTAEISMLSVDEVEKLKV